MKIAKLRKAKHITQAELAELCGTTQQQIAKIENGAGDPKLSTMRRISGAFGCEIKDLFWSRAEFLKEVNSIISMRKIKAGDIGVVGINSVCAQQWKSMAFHPFWEDIEIKNNKAVYRQRNMEV